MRPIITVISASVAGIALALNGTASGQAIFSTMNGFTVSLSSYNGSPVASSASYSGPATTGGPASVSVGNLSAPNTGDGSFSIDHFFGWDKVEASYRPGAGVGDYNLRFEWDITFNSVLGGVKVSWWSGSGQPTKATPIGGSEVSFAAGDVFANGRYIISWEAAVTNEFSSFSRNFGFQGSSDTPTIGASGGAVPLPGAAGLAACGLLGLSRRRRR